MRKVENENSRVIYEIAPVIWLTEVKPECRRNGAGTKILTDTLEELKSQGYKFAYCFLKPDDTRAIGFYEHNGFVKKADKIAYFKCLNDDWKEFPHQQIWGQNE